MDDEKTGLFRLYDEIYDSLGARDKLTLKALEECWYRSSAPYSLPLLDMTLWGFLAGPEACAADKAREEDGNDEA